MLLQKKIRGLVALTVMLVLSLSSFSTPAAQQQEATSEGTPVLWQEPTDIASRDLYLGPGGEAMKPDLSSVTFIKDEPGGYSTKYRVSDGAGNEWVVKVGNEAQPETAATRLLWAVGYVTDITYLVASVDIKGKGSFQNVRFEARPKDVKRLDEWDWKNNPFVGTKEFQGLKVMMVLLNNWDLKNSNNRILRAHNEEAGRDELRYIISDLGATFGKTGGAFTHNRNKPQDYVRTRFVVGVENDIIQFDYHGKNGDILRGITIEQSRWIGDLLSRLSDQQINDAFRAANYSQEDAQRLAGEVRLRINELASVP